MTSSQIIKASPRDFKKLWEQYQKDGAKRDITIALYCKCNGTNSTKYATRNVAKKQNTIKFQKYLNFTSDLSEIAVLWGYVIFGCILDINT